jgi:hypothetical protein
MKDQRLDIEIDVGLERAVRELGAGMDDARRAS